MKKKKIVALLLATSVMATSPALFTNPMMVLAEEAEGTSGEQIEVNTETIATNTSTIVTNEGTVETNAEEGTITTNEGTVTTNEGTVETNAEKGTITTNEGTVTTNEGTVETNTDAGTITTNEGKITNNNGFITSNKADGTVEKNNLSITNNLGTVIENAQIKTEDGIKNAAITTNEGTVEVNNGEIMYNRDTIVTNNNIVKFNYEGGIIEDNNKLVTSNHATVIINDTDGENGRVQENMNPGIVEIIINEEKTDEEIDTIVNSKVEWNFGEIVVKNSEDEVQTTYYGVSGNNGLTEKDRFGVYLDSVKENNTYTLSIPSGYGVDGTITLSQKYTDLEVIGATLERNENGDYIVPIGTQFKITGRLEFIGKWYKILQSSGAIVEVVQDTSSNDDTPTQVTPVVKDFTTSIAGVEINSWEDVSTVMNTKADTITAEPNSDFKLFKLELSKKQLTIPTSVVSNVATSKVDGLHCFIGDGDAITFIDNGTLGNYIPTDFTHTDKTTDDMKFINFTKPQAIGATVLLSTRVPVKNTPVAIWMLVDGKYELVGFDVSNETGNIAFPISSTGQFVLTY